MSPRSWWSFAARPSAWRRRTGRKGEAGYRDALVAALVVLNASSWGDFAVQHLVVLELQGDIDLMCGVYDLNTLPATPVGGVNCGPPKKWAPSRRQKRQRSFASWRAPSAPAYVERLLGWSPIE